MAKAITDGSKELKPEWKIFSEEYVFDYNGTRAYQVAYPKASYDTARANQSKLLAKACIKKYIEEIQEDLAKLSGISRLRVAKELEKMVFSSIAHLHNTWIDRKAFEELTDEQKDCISEIYTRTKKVPISVVDPDTGGTVEIDTEVEEVRIKLYDKQKAIEAMNKMLGFNAPDKKEITGDPLSNITVIHNGKSVNLGDEQE